jgi:UDP:flavonoid glycosyltransferase YjiC (YdhE family)
LVGDRTLVVGIPETDPIPGDPDVTWVGPILWEEESTQLPQWIKELSSERKLVWLYPGNMQYARGTRTSFDSVIVLEACIAALADQPLNVVLSVGSDSLRRWGGELPSNFYHVNYVPGMKMAARSDLLIHHGGYGSCQMGLVAGKPAMILPTFSERESNARRVAEQGAAEVLVPKSIGNGRQKTVSAGRVRELTYQILSECVYRTRAEHLSHLMSRYGGAQTAASLIAHL